MDCLAREKRKNSAQKMNKAFIEPRRVDKVCIAKRGLVDDIKEEKPKGGCDFVRVDLDVGQEASNLEPGQGVVRGAKGNEIEVHQEVMQGDRLESDAGITQSL